MLTYFEALKFKSLLKYENSIFVSKHNFYISTIRLRQEYYFIKILINYKNNIKIVLHNYQFYKYD